MCLTTYAAVIGLFIVSGLATSMPPMTTLPRRFFADLRALVARPAALVVAGAVLRRRRVRGGLLPRARRRCGQQAAQRAQPVTADQQSEFERYWTSLPQLTVPVPSDGAAVLIVKFTDYQCPPCGQSFFERPPHPGEVPGAVSGRGEVRHQGLPAAARVQRERAAAGAPRRLRCRGGGAPGAGSRGKGEALEEYFYSHQAMMTPMSVREDAPGRSPACRTSTRSTRACSRRSRPTCGLGAPARRHGTPTFFINGVKLDGAAAPQTIDLAIAYELKKAGRIK